MAAKSRFAEWLGLHGVAYWRGNEVFGQNSLLADPNGTNTTGAQAMWSAAAAVSAVATAEVEEDRLEEEEKLQLHQQSLGGYGGRGFFRTAV